MSLTRQYLRRRVAQQILEPFFVRVPAGQVAVVGTPGTVEEIPLGGDFIEIFKHNVNLVGSHVFVCSGPNDGDEFTITNFDSTNGTLSVYPVPDSAFTNGNLIEIHTRTTARAKNDAINVAVNGSYPYFYEKATQEVVIPEDTTELTSAHGLPTDWRRLLEVWLEPQATIHGAFDVNDAGMSNLFVNVDNVSWTADEWINFEVRFIRGSGVAGLYRTISDNDTDTLNWTSSLGIGTPLLDIDGVKIVIADIANNRYGDWHRQSAVMPMGNPYFTSLLLGKYIQSNVGRLLRLVGIKEHSRLDDDADTTNIPEEFIIYHVCTELLPYLSLNEPSSHAGSTQWAGRWSETRLEAIRQRLKWEFPQSTHWMIPPDRDRGYKDWASNPFSTIS
jgi:hypothetical protein